MLVVLQFGSRAGEVHDFLPHEARAMLADGRARPVVNDAPVVSDAPVDAANRQAAPVVRDPQTGGTTRRDRKARR